MRAVGYTREIRSPGPWFVDDSPGGDHDREPSRCRKWMNCEGWDRPPTGGFRLAAAVRAVAGRGYRWEVYPPFGPRLSACDFASTEAAAMAAADVALAAMCVVDDSDPMPYSPAIDFGITPSAVAALASLVAAAPRSTDQVGSVVSEAIIEMAARRAGRS